jgi:hypothetical protein
MSLILYYSNYCEHSKKLLQTLSKSQISKEIHFICIDNRVKENNKIYIILQNGSKIIMPDNIKQVPALLSINDKQVYYGDSIYNYLKPKQEIITKKATSNNMEPMAFSLGGNSSFGIISDQFSFLDISADDMTSKGNGGLRQMHNYVLLNDNMQIPTPSDDFDYKSEKISEGLTIEQLQQQRDQDIVNFKPLQKI